MASIQRNGFANISEFLFPRKYAVENWATARITRLRNRKALNADETRIIPPKIKHNDQGCVGSRFDKEFLIHHPTYQCEHQVFENLLALRVR